MLSGEESVLRHEYGSSPEPVRIKVERNTKGYNWEISISGKNAHDLILEVQAADNELREKFGVNSNGH
jgi:hypothetical protein